MAAYGVTASTASAQITATVYGNYTYGANNITYSDPLFSFDTSAVQYLNSLPNSLPYGNLPPQESQYWWPAGENVQYGVNFTGNLFAPVAGYYAVDLESDDGSVLHVNGNDYGHAGDQGPSASYNGTVFLHAGNNFFDLQFAENGAGQAGVDLNLGNLLYNVDQRPVTDQIPLTFGPAAVPDTTEFVALAPLALCAAHALRRRIKA